MSETPAAAMFANQRSREDQLIAVIDIGSNSVRLVVYKGLRRNPVVFFNERVICGLGTGLRSGDALAPKPMEMALQTLQRFAHLCKDMKVDQINAIATAAVRNAANKALFVDQIRERCGFDVNVISGEEEARFSALGAVAGFPGADGIVGDMGGGSLELVNLVDGTPQEKVSLPIGPLSLADGPTKAEASHREIVAKALAGVDWLGNGKGRPFYMVGGAWRALARLHMDATNYALTVHHSYRLAAAELAAFAHRISDQSPQSLPRARTIAAGRFDVIPLAAMILELSLIAANSECAIVSGTGIREGLLYDRLPEEIKSDDPYLAACRDLARETGRFAEHADRLMEWLDPLFEDESPAARRIRRACCLMSDMNWRGHPDFRAEHAFHRAFEGHFVGVSHGERAQTALALYVCYGGPKEGPEVARALTLLNTEEVEQGRLIGLGLRLGQRLTGGTAQPLRLTRLKVGGKKLKLIVPTDSAALAGGSVQKRLADLARLMELKPKIVLED